MNLGLRLVEMALLSGFVVAVTLAAVTALLQRPLCRLLDAQAPASRARIVAGILTAPMLIGIAYAFSTLLVSLYGVSSPSITAVCSGHHDSWLHACLGHPIALDSTSWLWMAFAAFLLVCAGLMLQLGRALLKAKRHLAALVRMGRRHTHHHQLHVLDTDAPLAVACDLGSGHVLLARWLIEALRPEQLQVVLAHEQAHLAHRDVRWRLLARIAAGMHVPGLRRRLLEALALACEQRCDQVAAEHVGSRLVVAETLLAVAHLYRRRQPMPGSMLSTAFGTGFLRQRVEALLDQRRKPVRPLGPALAASALALVLASTGWVHNVSEFLVTMLVI